MKRIITAALALSLIGGAAMAQDQQHRDEGGRGGGGHEAQRPGGGGRPGPAPGGRPGGAPGARPEGPGGRPGEGRPDIRPGGPGGPGGRPGVGAGFRGPGPGLRPGGFLADRGFRGGRFRGPAYRYPAGFGYRRWAFGAFLPAAFLGADYYLGSYWTYGLPAPPAGYHWIRVGPDALLVRFGDGYVLDAAYGIFY
jgi:Ni/Co efflux regulator RcnB